MEAHLIDSSNFYEKKIREGKGKNPDHECDTRDRSKQDSSQLRYVVNYALALLFRLYFKYLDIISFIIIIIIG